MSSRALLAPPSLCQPHSRHASPSAQLSMFQSQCNYDNININKNNNAMTLNMSVNNTTAEPFLFSDIRPLTSLVQDYSPIAAQPKMTTDRSTSNATIVSSAPSSISSSGLTTSESATVSPPSVIIADSSSYSSSFTESHDRTNRRHALPSSILLTNSQTSFNEAVTHPVPEFLCHLFTMLTDPQLSDIISWSVPTENETNIMGGGKKGIGKVVVHNPQRLQTEVLGKYYRHSCYASFQRQLNYFGFKKRLHGGKKGKLSPCSYVHDGVGDEPASLFLLKRRPPAKKRAAAASSDVDKDSVASISSEQSEKPQVNIARMDNDSEATRCVKKPRVTKKNAKKESVPEKGRIVSFDLKSPACDPLSAAIRDSMNDDSLMQNFERFVFPPNMPLMARVEGIPLPQASSSSPFIPPSVGNFGGTGTFVPQEDAVTSTYNDGISVMRANAAVREAQKSLEKAYRKSQRDHEEKDKALNGIGAQLSMPMQTQDQSSSSVPNPLSAPVATGSYVPMWNNLNYSYDYNCSNVTNSISNNFIGSSTSQYQQKQVTMNSNLPGIRSDTSSPIEFDDVFSKLLSTTLPTSEELFGDEMSSGSLAEEDLFDGSGLQVVDDGMLLP